MSIHVLITAILQYIIPNSVANIETTLTLQIVLRNNFQSMMVLVNKHIL